jgi:GntR family transcriptional repressor for pyruvate dehydrogenase complex
MAFIASAPVGTRLPAERELAARFGVSRTTLRSATDRLALLGYLSVRHGSGTHTRRPGPEQLAAPFAAALADGSWSISEVYAVRLLIEPALAAQVARRPSAEALASLRAAATAGDDSQFHTLLTRYAGNEVATQVLGVLIGLAGAAGVRRGTEASATRIAMRQHRAVIDALVEGDPELARESMQLHLRWEARQLTADDAS